MPVKRRVAKVREYRITPEAVAAFRAGDDTALCRLLGIRPWQASPLDATGPLPAWATDGPYAASWETARQLRYELEKAARI
jgi:hypothetical protein